MRKLKKFIISLVSDLKSTPISDVQAVYILIINMYLLYKISKCSFCVPYPSSKHEPKHL